MFRSQVKVANTCAPTEKKMQTQLVDAWTRLGAVHCAADPGGITHYTINRDRFNTAEISRDWFWMVSKINLIRAA